MTLELLKTATFTFFESPLSHTDGFVFMFSLMTMKMLETDHVFFCHCHSYCIIFVIIPFLELLFKEKF